MGRFGRVGQPCCCLSSAPLSGVGSRSSAQARSEPQDATLWQNEADPGHQLISPEGTASPAGQLGDGIRVPPSGTAPPRPPSRPRLRGGFEQHRPHGFRRPLSFGGPVVSTDPMVSSDTMGSGSPMPCGSTVGFRWPTEFRRPHELWRSHWLNWPLVLQRPLAVQVVSVRALAQDVCRTCLALHSRNYRTSPTDVAQIIRRWALNLLQGR